MIGENDKSKTCFCSVHADKCPCADYAAYSLRGNRKVTVVANYEDMQTPDRQGNLHELLHNNHGRTFTHALVMEPHEPCFFREKHGHGGNSHCEANDHGNVYGCGWSDVLWGHMVGRFGKDKGRLVHVVPWSVPDSFPHVAHEQLALRTHRIAKHQACETKLDPKHPTDRPPTAKPAVSAEHQCFAICDKSKSHCRTGSPSMMAAEAVAMLRHKGE